MHIVRVYDLDTEVPPIELVPIVSEFPEVFPNNLTGIPTKWEIDFCIVLLPDRNPISILLYRMAPFECEAVLKDFLDKGFIRPSISP